jgi:gp16 family phage-associated protein
MKKPTKLPADYAKRVAAFRKKIAKQGLSIAEWARQNDFNYDTVKSVLRGRYKGCYGQSHVCFVAMGLK